MMCLGVPDKENPIKEKNSKKHSGKGWFQGLFHRKLKWTNQKWILKNFMEHLKSLKNETDKRLMGKSDDQIRKENEGKSDGGTNCTCVICLDSRYEIRIKEEVLDQMRPKKVVIDEPKKENKPKQNVKEQQVMRKSKFFKDKELALLQ